MVINVFGLEWPFPSSLWVLGFSASKTGTPKTRDQFSHPVSYIVAFVSVKVEL